MGCFANNLGTCWDLLWGLVGFFVVLAWIVTKKDATSKRLRQTTNIHYYLLKLHHVMNDFLLLHNMRRLKAGPW